MSFKKYKYVLLSIISFCFSQNQYQEWNEGPYGTEFFDIAAPFTLNEINSSIPGDVNSDEILNVLDLIQLVGHILETSEFDINQISVADINNDSIVDILDIISIVNMIIGGYQIGWNFENEWNGYESYIFIHYNTAIAGSQALWLSNTKESLLNDSPDNVHYFFLSSRSTAESDVEGMANVFNEIIQEMSPEMQDHWNSHLHFCPIRVPELDNWLVDALEGEYAIGIDRFQRIKQIGYLGNPASFTGTYMNYLTHEAVYYNYEHNTLSEPISTYDEIEIFNRTPYTGGWAATISQIVTFPNDEILNNYDKMSVDLLRGCPDSNGNYSDQGCDDYDRIARMYICEEDGSECLEIAKWITPFDRQPHSLTDISPMLSTIRPGGSKMIKFQESGWPNSLLTLKFRFYDETSESGPTGHVPLWNSTVQFNPDYDENRPPQVFNVPENASKIEFVSFLSGHGWGSAGCFNCCEFCNSRHTFIINGGTHEFQKSHPNATDNNYCMELGTIIQGVVPNQYGTWGYGRAGWCPGMDVAPYIVDITNYVEFGQDNIIDYEACRVSGNSCVAPPTCQGDGYCPEVAMSSYIVIYE